MLVSAVGAGIVAGLVLKGRLTNLVSLRIRWLTVFLLAVLGHALSMAPIYESAARVVYFFSLCALVAFMAANWRLAASPLATVGVASNALAVGTHGGAMPVSPEAVVVTGARTGDSLHVISSDALPFGDVIPLPPFGVYSVGDLALAVAVFLFIVSSMRPSK